MKDVDSPSSLLRDVANLHETMNPHREDNCVSERVSVMFTESGTGSVKRKIQTLPSVFSPPHTRETAQSSCEIWKFRVQGGSCRVGAEKETMPPDGDWKVEFKYCSGQVIGRGGLAMPRPTRAVGGRTEMRRSGLRRVCVVHLQPWQPHTFFFQWNPEFLPCAMNLGTCRATCWIPRKWRLHLSAIFETQPLKATAPERGQRNGDMSGKWNVHMLQSSFLMSGKRPCLIWDITTQFKFTPCTSDFCTVLKRHPVWDAAHFNPQHLMSARNPKCH